jgi:hypothetical protein
MHHFIFEPQEHVTILISRRAGGSRARARRRDRAVEADTKLLRREREHKVRRELCWESVYTDSQPGNYTTSLIGNWTVDFISRHTAAARSGTPFFGPGRPGAVKRP